MGLGVAVGSYVSAQIRFARSQTMLGQSSAKQLVAQPDAVRVHDIGLAICGDFGDAPLATVLLDIRTAHSVTLPWKPHDATQLVQRRLVWGAEGRQRVAQVNRVFGKAIEISTRGQPRRANPTDHCAIAQNRQVKRAPLTVTS